MSSYETFSKGKIEEKPQNEQTAKGNFYLFCAAVLSFNFDMGLFPLSVKLIMQDLNINHTEVAFMGTCVNLGISFCCLISPFVFRKFQTKSNFLVFLCVHLSAMIIFGCISNFYIMVILRFISGVAAGAHLIYYPVWINNFGPENLRGTWIGIVSLANPIGTTLGIAASSAFILTMNTTSKWRFPIILQIFLEGFLIFKFLRLKNEDVDVNVKHPNLLEENSHDLKILLADVWLCFKNKIVVLGAITLSIFYFSVAGLQFWAALYIEKIFDLSKSEALLIYISLSLIASVSGIFFGGFLADKIVKCFKKGWI